MYSIEEYFLLNENAFKQRDKKFDPVLKMEVCMTCRVVFYSLIEHRILNNGIYFISIFQKNTHNHQFSCYNESPSEGHLIVKDVLIIPSVIAMYGKSTTFADEVRSASNIDTDMWNL